MTRQTKAMLSFPLIVASASFIIIAALVPPAIVVQKTVWAFLLLLADLELIWFWAKWLCQ